MYDDWILTATTVAAAFGVGLAWGPASEWLGGHGRDARALRDEMREAGMDAAALPTYLLWWRGLAVGIIVVVWGIFQMVPVAIVLAVIAYLAGPWWVRYRIRGYRRKVNEQVAGVARNLGGQVRVGLPLHEALGVAAADAPSPLGDHLRQTALQIDHGAGVRAALGDLKSRVRVEGVTSMTVALQVVDEKGGPLADVLDRVAFTAEELARVERKRDTDTAAGRLMIWVMAAFPILFLVIVGGMEPTMVEGMFRTQAGHYVLAAVAVLVSVSVRWGSRILSRVE